MRFYTPFITGERVQSVKINFFIEKTGNNSFEEDAQYSEEYKKCQEGGNFTANS